MSASPLYRRRFGKREGESPHAPSASRVPLFHGMETLKALVGLLAMPIPLTALLAVFGVCALALGIRRTGQTLLVLAPLVVVLAAWGPVADRLLAPLEQAHPPIETAPDRDDIAAVVVLGSGYYPQMPLPVTSRLNDSAVVRLTEGIRLYRQLTDVPLLVSGGSRVELEPSSAGYAAAAIALGVPAESIIELNWPADTAQEAYGTRELLGQGATIILVTSASHMARSVRHFRHVGLNPIPAPTRHKVGMPTRDSLAYWIPTAGNLRKTERALYEYMGMVSLRLDHR